MKRKEGWKILVPAAALGWLLLFNEAVVVNINQKEAEVLRLQEEYSRAAEKRQEEKKRKAEEKEGQQEGQQEEPPARTGEEEEPSVRVLLMNSDYSSYVHPAVTVHVEGEEHTYTRESLKGREEPLVLEAGETGIQVISIRRQEGNPVYYGTLEISAGQEGLLLVNEVPVETYLEAVVPSEMPASYSREALMAQAVCARTYAYSQMENGSLKETYRADVDDSVNFQVYQNIFPKEETTEAVRATKGQVLCQNGELIEAFYFSTSSGMTSTDEIWGAEEAAAYLKSVECSFDAEEPWSRWSVEIPWETLAERAQELPGCSGGLLALSEEKKSQSGAVTQLLVVTEGGRESLSGEYRIRQFLSPLGLTVTEKNGVESPGNTLLPSSYFSMEVTEGRSVTIKGGGYGHGVGMSQTAANEMAKEGYSCEEILNYFFRDIEIVPFKTM